MLRRLGFAGRLMAIVLLSLLAVWILGVGWFYVMQEPKRHLLLPLPKQAAAIVELLEATDPQQRGAILAAVNSDTLTVTLSATPPTVSPNGRRLTGVEWLVGHRVETFGDREVIALLDRPSAEDRRELRLGPFVRYADNGLRMAVSLKSGGYAVFETRGEFARRLFGFPPGFWMGALGSLIGITAILAVAREARPLAELARSVARFRGDEADPIAMQPRGAPEISKLIAAINEMQARIAALVRSRMMFFGAVSHDLKTYITRLRLRVETIPDDNQRERAVRDLDEMTALIDDALAVARSTAVSSRREPVDLAKLIRADVEERPANLVTLKVARDAVSVHLSGDAIALRRLFANLIDNALRFGKTCQVSMRCERGTAVILVDDDGPGIPAEERLAVLEPFYRLETSRSRATGGSGLGLAIAKEIVAAHGGTIAIGASPQGGARVRIELPYLHEEAQRASRPERSPRRLPGMPFSPQNSRTE